MEHDIIEMLTEALEASPNNTKVRLRLATLLAEQGRSEEAEAHYKYLIAQQLEVAKAQFGLACLYCQTGKFGAASLLLEPLHEVAPDDIETAEWYCRALIGEKNIERAVSVYRDLQDIYFGYRNEEFDQALLIKSVQNREGDDDVFDQDFEDFGDVSKPKITFEDIGGMDRVKDEISKKILMPMRHPEIFAQYGKKAGGGILMYGPPGCGKTYIARATAGEMGAKFINVGINDVLDMYIGNSEKNIHEIFEKARLFAPCVLFFDEIDALGLNRKDFKYSAGRSVVNTLLSEMDNVNSSNEGVLVIGATNAPWSMDPALLRPGRFDRIIFVDPPDEPGREAILDIHLRNVPHDVKNLKKIAQSTNELSGADLKAVVDKAVESKLDEAFASGQIVPVTDVDLLKAAKMTSSSAKDWFNTARNYAMYANDSGIYNDVLRYLKLR